MKRLHITTGDPDGIGLEVACKALSTLIPLPGVQFVLWRASQNKNALLTPDYINKLINNIQKSCRVVSLKDPQKLNSIDKNDDVLIDIACDLDPTEWVVHASQHCLLEPAHQALVTGPLSKTQMQHDGFSEIGHTPLLKKLSHTKDVFMAFLGKQFNVVLLTGHVSLKNITWDQDKLDSCIKWCLLLRKYLSAGSQNKPIAVVGLNPHAGEQGLIGKEEITLSQQLQKWKHHIVGPLVPDVAFLKNNWDRFSMYICLYHDQGLIPFKIVHERESFQLSLGLPFVRTSVSHGTAKDIFGHNKAVAESMKKALLFAGKWEPPPPWPTK